MRFPWPTPDLLMLAMQQVLITVTQVIQECPNLRLQHPSGYVDVFSPNQSDLGAS